MPAAGCAALTTPSGSTLTGTTANFSWPAVAGADQYWLAVGNATGLGDIFASATSGTSLPIIIGGTQTAAGDLPANGIPAQVTRTVQGIDSNGNIVSGSTSFTAISAGEMLLGTFTITYTVNNQQITQSLSVLRAAP